MQCFNPYSSEIDSVRRQLNEDDVKIVALTAPHGIAGVSIFCQALAVRQALAGENTLLVDLNIDSPMQHRLFGVQRHDWSIDKDGGLDAVSATDLEGLSVLAAPAASGDLLRIRDPEQLKQGFAKWRDSFDRVIIDCAAITQSMSSILSAEMIGEYCDQVLLVLMTLKTGQPEMKDAVDRLKNEHINFGGVIMNDYQNLHLSEELMRAADKVSPHSEYVAESMRGFVRRSVILNLNV